MRYRGLGVASRLQSLGNRLLDPLEKCFTNTKRRCTLCAAMATPANRKRRSLTTHWKVVYTVSNLSVKRMMQSCDYVLERNVTCTCSLMIDSGCCRGC
jgi:hypothetical protein